MSKTQDHRSKGYDLPMIRDFIDHLGWELRAMHLDNSSTGGRTHGELVEVLEKYERKYGRALVPFTASDKDGCTAEEVELGKAAIRELNRNRYQEAIDHLEALHPIFEDALQCAAAPFDREHPPVRCFKIRDILDAGKHGDANE